MAKMKETTLRSIMDQWLRESINFAQEKVGPERAEALDYYNGKPLGTEIEGRSQVRATEVQTTVEWIKPSLLRIFTGGDQAITISGQTEQDVQNADTAQAWVEYVINRMNAGFMMYYSWFHDALLQKTGYVKTGWQTKDLVFPEMYKGISEAALTELERMDNYEVLEVEGYQVTDLVQDPETGQVTPIDMEVFDVKANRLVSEGQLMIDPVPPEEILTLKDSIDTSEDGSRFWCHRTQKSISYVRAMGYDVPDDISSSPLMAEATDDVEDLARHYSDSSEWGEIDDGQDSNLDPASKLVWFYECHMKVDYDGDGRTEWVRVHRVANKILDVKTVRRPNISSLCPIPMPHRHHGKSMADLMIPVERLKTSILRLIMDYMYFTVNPRAEMVEGGMGDFTLSDWLNNQPNQPIRVRAQGTVVPFTPPQIPAAIFSMLEWVDQDGEKRTGVSRFNQGLSPDTLNKTATGIVSLINQAVQRIELIARIFAETGVRDLVLQILEQTMDYPEMVADKVIRLTDGKSIQISAQSISGQYDLVVNVGAGSADKTQQMQHVMGLLQVMQQAIAMGAGPQSGTRLIRWQNLYNAIKEFISSAGLKNPSDFITDPDSPDFMQQVQPPPNPDMLKLQVEQQKMQLEHQRESTKIQQDGQAKMKELEIKARELALAQQELELEVKRLELEATEAGAKIADMARNGAEQARPEPVDLGEREIAALKVEEAREKLKALQAKNAADLKLIEKQMEVMDRDSENKAKESKAKGDQEKAKLEPFLKQMVESNKLTKQLLMDIKLGAEKESKPEKKVVEITTPRGEKYTGTVTEK